MNPLIFESIAKLEALAKTDKYGRYQVGGDVSLRDLGNQFLTSVESFLPSQESLIEFGKDVTPIWGDVRAAQSGIAKLQNAPNPTEYIEGNQFNLNEYQDAVVGQGTGAFLDLASVVPGVAGLGYGAMKYAKNMESVPSMFGQSGAIASTNALNADLDALARAEKMKAQGVPTDDIYTDTKWWLEHPDGRPRFEIDDSKSRYSNHMLGNSYNSFPSYKTGSVGDALAHVNLYDNYPKIKSHDFVEYPFKGKARGQFREGIESLGMKPSITLWDAGKRDAPDWRDASDKSVALHEVQHDIQMLEGMGRGGNDSMFKQVTAPKWIENKDMADEYYSLINSDKYQKELKLSNDMYDEKFEKEFDSLLDRFQNKEITGAELKELKDKHMQSFDDWSRINTPSIFRADEIVKTLGRKELTPTDQYRMLAGESEARLVQKRMDLSMADRMKYPFYKEYDVPLEDQIVRYK